MKPNLFLTYSVTAFLICFGAACAGPLDTPKPSTSPSPPAGSPLPSPLSGVDPVAIAFKIPLPFVEIEAESMSRSGSAALVGPGTTYLSPQSEASGRRFVKLVDAGDSLSFTVTQTANSIVVRYSVPDSATGGTSAPNTAELELRVNGSLKKTLTLTSAYAWVYGTPAWGTGSVWSQNPAAGSAHRFFDEVSSLIDSVVPGDVISLSKKDNATSYISIDLVDLENVAAPLSQPAGSVQFNADNSGASDVTAALQNLIDANPGAVIYVPQGEYRIGSVDVTGITIQGAGIWYTRFVGPESRFQCAGDNNRFYDFAVFGETDGRADTDSGASNAFNGNPGSGSVLERIWVEHKKCAFWVGEWNNPTPTDGLRIAQCRFRNLSADAVNFCNGTSNSVVDNSHIRYSGDDALASWSPRGGGPLNSSNVFSNNTIQLPWIANGIAVYGGENMTIANNTVSDSVVSSSGIFIADRYFDSRSFGGTIRISGNTLVRCGSNASALDSLAGALRIFANDKTIDAATIVVDGNLISASVASGISIHGPQKLSGLHFYDNDIQNSGSYGIQILSTATGWATFEKTSVGASAISAFTNSSVNVAAAGGGQEKAFAVVKGAQNAGW